MQDFLLLMTVIAMALMGWFLMKHLDGFLETLYGDQNEKAEWKKEFKADAGADLGTVVRTGYRTEHSRFRSRPVCCRKS